MTAMRLNSQWFAQSKWLLFLINGLLFQCAWFVCVLTEDALWGGLAALVCIGVYAIFLKSFCNQVRPEREVIWLIALALIGIGFEKVLFGLNLLEISQYSQQTLFGVNAWLVCIWLAFSSTFRFCFSFLVKDLRIAPFAGFFACGSYASGAALSNELALAGSFWVSTIYIGLLWALLMPLLCAIYKFLCWPDPNKN